MTTHKKAIGVYPGTFDPITNGHLDIIQRAANHLVDRLIVAVARNDGKAPYFDIEARLAMVRDEVAPLNRGHDRVIVRDFDNLLVDFVDQVGARMIIRGLRAVSDFEYEFQMAAMNGRLNPEVETVFLRFVKEIARLGGDIRHFVSPAVAEQVTAHFARLRLGQGEPPDLRTVEQG
jgi:pantetheine-phosphate adenylyltransferase